MQRPVVAPHSTWSAQQGEDAALSVPTIIIDKSAIFRAGLTSILSETRFRVLTDCASLNDVAAQYLENLTQQATLLLIGVGNDLDSVLLDVSRLRKAKPLLVIILFVERLRPGDAITIWRSGASGCLAKNVTELDILWKTLELVMLGEAVFILERFCAGADLAGDLIAPVSGADTTAASDGLAETVRLALTARLSDRERLILSHVIRGASNKHIARELGIAEATVKVHMKSILRKAGARKRTEAAIWGIGYFEREATRAEGKTETTPSPLSVRT